MVTGSRKWAVKCFTRQIPGLHERYQQIGQHLANAKLRFMVDFTFLERGIHVRGQWYPILKMQWVEGLTLNQFVKNNLDKPHVIDLLCHLWAKLARRLRDANIAHCDLQHGNVLLVPSSKAGVMQIKLVDYDGMCVPALTLLKSIEVGHPAYQHPQRQREGIYSLEVDRFSHLVIYTALRALMAEGKALWDKHDDGDNLLFKGTDYTAPTKSRLFHHLLKSPSGEVRRLVQALVDNTSGPLDRVPLLQALIAPGLETAVQKKTAAMGLLVTPRTAPGVPNPPDIFPGVTQILARLAVKPARTGITKKSMLLPVVGCVLGVAVVVGAAALVLRAGAGTDETPAVIIQRPANEPGNPAPAIIQKSPDDSAPRGDVERKVTPSEPAPIKPEPKAEAKDNASPEPKPKLPAKADRAPQPIPKIPLPLADSSLADLRRFEANPDHIQFLTGCDLSSNGRYAISTSTAKKDSWACIWDLRTGRPMHRLEGNSLGGRFSPDSMQVLTYGEAQDAAGNPVYTIRVWDVATGRKEMELQCPGEPASLTFPPNGLFALSLCHVQSLAATKQPRRAVLQLWERSAWREIGRVASDRDIIAVALSPDGSKALTGTSGAVGANNILLWDLKASKIIERYHGHAGPITAVAFAPDGEHFVSAGVQGTCLLWNVKKAVPIRQFAGDSREVIEVFFSQSGKELLTTGTERMIRKWEVATGKLLQTVDLSMVWGPLTPEKLPNVALSKDFRYAFFPGMDRGFYLCRLSAGEATYLSDMGETDVSATYFRNKGRMDNVPKAGGRMRFNEYLVPKGILLHPGSTPARVTYRLGKRFQTFITGVGVADNANGESTVPLQFIVLGDGKTLWSSKVVQKCRELQFCCISVHNIDALTLIVETSASANDWAWAAWLQPHLLTDAFASNQVGPIAQSNPPVLPQDTVSKGRAVDLLNLIKTSRDAVQGRWVLEGKALISPGGPTARYQDRIAVPYIPPDEYSLELQVERRAGGNCFSVGLVAENHQFLSQFDGWPSNGYRTGLQLLDRKNIINQQTAKWGQILRAGRVTDLRFLVTKARITVKANNSLITYYQGSYSRLTLEDDWAIPDRRVLFVGSNESSFRITKMLLIPISGNGSILPVAGAGKLSRN